MFTVHVINYSYKIFNMAHTQFLEDIEQKMSK